MEQFVGIVLGGDMNSYAVARAFYEAYKIKTIIIGQYPIYPTTHSKIIESYYYKDLLTNDTLKIALTDIQNKYPNKKKILLGNTDYYVRHIMINKENILKISNSYIIPMTTVEQFDELFNKDTFYKLCDKYNLNYPKSITFDFIKDDIDCFTIPFEYPIFLKPANTVIYADYEFNGKQKGYKIDSLEDFKKVIKIIKNAQYKDKFIIQEYISGNDETMFVYTAYVNKSHKVVGMSGGRILMHDRTPELIGNYNAITNAYDKELCLKLKEFLENIKFTGICHFDIQYDTKRKKYYVFEINIRQGRSNYYNLASGLNLAKLIVDDYIYNKNVEFFIANKPFTASVVPKWALKKSLKKHNIKLDIINFSRFTLAKYDFNLLRLYYQYRWDRKVIKAYFKYN